LVTTERDVLAEGEQVTEPGLWWWGPGWRLPTAEEISQAQRQAAIVPEATAQLGAAWAAVEAALPPDHVYFGLTHPNPNGSWWASVHGPTLTERCDHGVEHESYPRENGYGSTPTEALNNLRAALAAESEAK
jgi:hypothetical protein